MSEKEVVLNQEFLFAEYIDSEKSIKTPDYIKVKYRKIEQYSFYLRFVGKWFYPCSKDQAKIKEIIENYPLHISTDRATIHFLQQVNKEGTALYYEFGFPWVDQLIMFTFKPCVKCQKNIAETLKESSTFIIGNDKYEHPIELNKKNEQDDKSMVTVEKHLATKEEINRIGEHWLYERISEETYNKAVAVEDV